MKSKSNQAIYQLRKNRAALPQANYRLNQQLNQRLRDRLKLGLAVQTAQLSQSYSQLQREKTIRQRTERQIQMLQVAVIQNMHNRKQMQEVLAESAIHYRSIIDVMAEGIVLQDANGVIQASNANAEQMLGLSHDQMIGRTLLDPGWHVIYPDGSPFPGYQHPAMLTLRTGKPCTSVTMGVYKPNGSLTWLSVNTQPIFRPGEPQKPPHAVVVSCSDITERKQIEQELFREKELAQFTLQSIGDAVITTDACCRVQYLNPVAEALTGWSQAEAKGQVLSSLFQIVDEETRLPLPNPVEQALHNHEIIRLTTPTLLIARDGREIAIHDSAAPIRTQAGAVIGAVLVFRDISQTRKLTRQLSWQASHDALTGLVNRREFEQRLEQAVSYVKAQDLKAAKLNKLNKCDHLSDLSAQNFQDPCHILCYLDLDRFKIVNDTCGHAAGDELLRQVAELFEGQIRNGDTLARLGGDEFGILLHHCPLEKAIRIANRLREQVQSFRFAWEDRVFTIGVSIGLVTISAESQDITTVLSAADVACYTAKNRGRNRVQVYQTHDPDLTQRQNEMQWVRQLTQALEADQFCLYYQPIVSIAHPKQQGEHYEVLLRLRSQYGELIPPGAFVPIAERYNLMHLIDRWVIRTLFATQAEHYRQAWKRCQQEDATYLYAINLSGASLNDDQFIDFLHEQFALHRVPPQVICFEITETVAIANLTKAAQLIGEFRSLGCRFALDDFGSGMSSFAYLKNLPVDCLKIDGGFIKQIVESSIDSVIVKAINQIGQAMGLQTIAEFVENDLILEKLRLIGVDYAQGYGISKPKLLDLDYPV
jgi:diguanylate cyclase (GGDEF)-like protein/PAS domain S-box-containing protein